MKLLRPSPGQGRPSSHMSGAPTARFPTREDIDAAAHSRHDPDASGLGLRLQPRPGAAGRRGPPTRDSGLAVAGAAHLPRRTRHLRVRHPTEHRGLGRLAETGRLTRPPEMTVTRINGFCPCATSAAQTRYSREPEGSAARRVPAMDGQPDARDAKSKAPSVHSCASSSVEKERGSDRQPRLPIAPADSCTTRPGRYANSGDTSAPGPSAVQPDPRGQAECELTSIPILSIRCSGLSNSSDQKFPAAWSSWVAHVERVITASSGVRSG